MNKIVKGVFGVVLGLSAGLAGAVTVEKDVEITLEAEAPEAEKAFHHWEGTGAPTGEAAFQPTWTYVPTASGEVTPVYGALVTVADGDDLAAAVATASADGGFGVVRAGAGTYTISAQLSLGSVRLEGSGRDGDGASVIRQEYTVDSKGVQNSFCRALYLNNKYAYVSGFQVNGFNCGGTDGAGVYIDANGGTVVDCRFTGNGSATAHKAGGSVYCKSASGLIARCIIDNNHMDYGGLNSNAGGAGAYMTAGAMENCLLYGNYATRFGGGIQIAGEVSVRNCTIVGNHGRDSGGGVYVGNGSASVVNCAIMDNKSTSYTQSNGGSEWITTTLLWSNNFVNCASTLPIGVTGLVADGDFADAANFDYTLLPGSALVNAGSDSGTALSLPLDLNGNPRVSGEAIDIGCCELDETTPSLGFRTEPREALVGDPVRFIPEGRGRLSVGACAWTVTDADGATVASFTDGEPVQTFATPGCYTVSLSAGGATLTRPGVLLVGARTNVVTTLTSAAIQAAIDAAVPGATVVLADGTYDIRQELEIRKPINLTSQNGAEKCILKMAAGNDYKPYRILRLNDGGARVEGITFTGAHCSGEIGFGVLIGGNGGLLDHCVVSNNVDSAYHLSGAGISMWGDRAIVRNTLIANNKLTQSKTCYGGGVYLTRGTVENCLIKDNHAYQLGGGVYFNGSEGNVINCTIVNNKAYGQNQLPNEGGGVYLSSKLGNGRVVNCAFYGNSCDLGSSTTSRDWYCKNATAKDMFIKCAFETEAPNATCFVPENANFKFADVDSGDYRLNSLSELVDEGDDTYVNPVLVKDFGGKNDRILGDHVDIGCYEADVATFVCDFDVSPRAALAGSNVVFAAATAGASDDAVYSWTVREGDAAVALDAGLGSCVTNRFAPGWYTVALAVSFGGVDYPVAKTNFLHVGAYTNYVVATWGDGYEPQLPYGSWETAATNVLEAVEEAVDGSVVMLGDGVYTLSEVLLLAKELRLTSLHGKEATELTTDNGDKKYGDNVNNMHRVIKINHPKAVVERVTVSKGRVTDNGVGGCGVLIGGNGGTLRDCIVERNGPQGQHTPGGGVTIQSSAGTVDRCIIRFNSAVGSGQNAGGGIHLMGGTVRNTLIYGNRARSGSGIYVRSGSPTIENCTIVSNVCNATDTWEPVKGSALALESKAFVTNTVVWGNEDTQHSLGETEKNVRIKGEAGVSNATVFTHCALPAALGTAPVVIGPTDLLFRRFVPELGKFDFRLSPNSPLRDRGVELDWMDGATDLIGNPRILNRIPDIGAYETALKGLLLFVK